MMLCYLCSHPSSPLCCSCDCEGTLKEETFAEGTFAISRFLAKFAKVCSREIFVIYKSQKFILAKKKSFRLAKVKKPKNIYIP